MGGMGSTTAAYKGLLSDPKAVLRRVSAAGMAYRNTKGQNSLIGTRMEAAAEKEAEGLCHMLQDQDILKREPPVSTCSDIRMQLQAVLKAYHCKQDDTSFSKKCM